MMLEIRKNAQGNGYCCDFFYNGKKYYADLCYLPCGLGTECMIFAYKKGEINWTDLYCKRGIPVTVFQLKRCIEEFTGEAQEWK